MDYEYLDPYVKEFSGTFTVDEERSRQFSIEDNYVLNFTCQPETE